MVKIFYKKEFGVDVDNLWLFDVFEYSAALPQILKLGNRLFFNPKISWNQLMNFHFKHSIGEE